MSILLSERQTDDLCVPSTHPLRLLITIFTSHKAILDYLHNAGFTKSFQQFKEDAQLVCQGKSARTY